MEINTTEQPKRSKKEKERHKYVSQPKPGFFRKFLIRAVLLIFKILVRPWLLNFLMVYLPEKISSAISYGKAFLTWIGDIFL